MDVRGKDASVGCVAFRRRLLLLPPPQCFELSFCCLEANSFAIAYDARSIVWTEILLESMRNEVHSKDAHIVTLAWRLTVYQWIHLCFITK